MRRKDKMVAERVELENIIKTAPYMVLGINSGAEPYTVPLDFGYADGYVYFHCASEGHKLDLLAQDNRVSLLFVNYGGVFGPPDAKQACSFSTRYKSVMAIGKAELIESLSEKEKAMRIIIDKLGIEQLPIPEQALAKICLVRIHLTEITGKQSPKPDK